MDGLIQLSLQYGPYVVVVGIILLFLLCCYFLFRDGKSNQKHTTQSTTHGDAYYEQRRRNFQNPYALRDDMSIESVEESAQQGDLVASEERSHGHIGAIHPTDEITVTSDLSDYTMPLRTADSADWNESKGIVSSELVRAVSEQPLEEADDATRIIPKITDETLRESDISEIERPSVEEPPVEEAIPERPATEESSTAGGTTEGPNVDAIAPDNTGATETTVVDKAVAQYVSAFGILNPQSEQHAKYITEYVLSQLGATSEEELVSLLTHVEVQDSLLDLQKAYVANPTEWMRDLLTDTFRDVVQQPRSSTLYLVAVDALKSLMQLQKGHLQALALALILQYSKNSNNYSLEHFQHYVERYLESFLSELPTRDDMYQQLEYLRCTSMGNEVSFEQILRNSYPLVFDYRGFTYEELDYVMQQAPVRASITVESLNSSSLQLAAIDEYMLPNLYQRAGITDQDTQQALTQLAYSKPFDWAHSSFDDVLERISPVLLNLCHTYNRIPLCRLNLTLLGLYLGRGMVKATINEHFDISPWFN
ncbi:LPO_1073/Vpar_1526 family protein [Veillonella sp. VA139]|uniref:LPO_1073/Vpar_1526 family protein n=1 Tax=Veillonella sp. VA139 TaxID=741830 RepID=UPI000F8DE5FA|nr:LPO_1073/Vpar_1526 family protein [Veillonella sp. VA139]